MTVHPSGCARPYIYIYVCNECASKQLRYEARKRDRLLEKAKNLSDQDLVSLMAGRAQARAKAASKAKGKNP